MCVSCKLSECVFVCKVETITQPRDEWGLWMSFFSVFVREWTGRASGGDREEEQGDVGKWFSRWDLICETMHPKETFSHGPTPWIQIHPATRSALEGRMHLASTRSGEVQLFLFFSSLNVYFHPITKLNWGDFMAAVMSHPFILL